MKKTLKIEVTEVLGTLASKDFDTKKFADSFAGSALVETETDIFFLLDDGNYKDFCRYFEMEIDEEVVSGIYTFFGVTLEG